MKSIELIAEIVEQINAPITQACGLPNHAYTSPEFFVLERDKLFARRWTCIGHACSIPSPGDVEPVNLMGLPLLMLRNKDGEVKVFHNVCSHRGNELVWAPCTGKKVLACPYHSWTYDLSGKLIGTPHIGGHGKHQAEGFDRAKHALREVPATVWMDLVFVNLDANAANFDTYIAPLQARIDTLGHPDGFSNMRPAREDGFLEWQVEANWKLCIENNLESYHLPWVHPDLNAISRLEDHYHFYGDDLYAGQGSIAYAPDRGNLPGFPLFPGWTDQRAEYPTLFPNVFLGMQNDHFWTIIIEPVAVGKTRERLQLYYLNDAAVSETHTPTRKTQLDTWAKVFAEDIGVVEGMYRGRQSPAFTGGVFSPKMDDPTHHFHKWVANQLAA